MCFLFLFRSRTKLAGELCKPWKLLHKHSPGREGPVPSIVHARGLMMIYPSTWLSRSLEGRDSTGKGRRHPLSFYLAPARSRHRITLPTFTIVPSLPLQHPEQSEQVVRLVPCLVGPTRQCAAVEREGQRYRVLSPAGLGSEK